MTAAPARTRDYIGPVTDTRIWDQFELRPGDIILSTPPKCGMTWSQAILIMLLEGAAVTDRAIWRESIGLDCGFRDQQVLKATLDAETRRRCIKSHTPFDGIPFSQDIIYIAVYRHPVDVHFSMMKHISNMKDDILDYLLCDSPQAAFERFLAGPKSDRGTDDLTLEVILHHYRSFARWAHLPNVHFAHYADLSADLPGQIRRYASMIGVEASEDMVTSIAQAASFGSMKETARQRLDGVDDGAFVRASTFFDSATSNKWEGRLADADVVSYRTRFAALATPQEIDWLENGSRGAEGLRSA